MLRRLSSLVTESTRRNRRKQTEHENEPEKIYVLINDGGTEDQIIFETK